MRWLPLCLAAACVCSEAPPRRDDAVAPTTRTAGSSSRVVDAGVPPASARPSPPVPPPVPPPEAPVVAELDPCRDSVETRIFSSPRHPRPGVPLRVVAVTRAEIHAALVVRSPDGREIALERDRRGATPYWWYAEVTEPVVGAYRVGLGNGTEVAACKDVRVGAYRREEESSPGGAVWPVQWSWERDTENLYSAWIERLFDDPLDAQPSWHGLSAILTDPRRNFLHDHLGLGEDASGRRGMYLEPDCADLPFFLRAYFAWKLRLPFGYSRCSRGTRFGAPRCSAWSSNLRPRREVEGSSVGAMEQFLKRDLAWAVHSGTARTPLEDDETDLYPARLTPESLRPGAVYADPYGHTLILVRRIPQTETSGGILLAVDAQPDGTVARKRYWRGNFLFAVDPTLGGAGFKHFRPIVREAGELRALTNREIERHPEYGDFSLEQREAGVEGFYDRVEDVLSPTPLDPERALRETIDALDEQIRTRIGSVQNGVDFVAERPGTIRMPEGAEIFETTGAWEDYSTPARDLRILIAMDVVLGFPERVVRRSSRYAMPAGRSHDDVRTRLEAVLREESTRRRYTYVRSDRSEWTLTLGDVLDRRLALEMAYNPNDCVEVRWGAPQGSPEASTCNRRAPGNQAARMAEYRPWFHDRRRPPRD